MEVTQWKSIDATVFFSTNPTDELTTSRLEPEIGQSGAGRIIRLLELRDSTLASFAIGMSGSYSTWLIDRAVEQLSSASYVTEIAT